jgi:hypothetical protein
MILKRSKLRAEASVKRKDGYEPRRQTSRIVFLFAATVVVFIFFVFFVALFLLCIININDLV